MNSGRILTLVFGWFFVGNVCGMVPRNGTEPPTVRVRITEDFKETNISGFDLRLSSLSKRVGITNIRAGFPGSEIEKKTKIRVGQSYQRLVADSRSSWDIKCLSNGKIELSIERSQGKTVWIAETPLRIEALSGFLKWKSESDKNPPSVYRDEIWIHSTKPSNLNASDSSKKTAVCEAINHVSIEKYLDGLVNGEISAEWSSATIDAQVIAARTYAYYQSLEAKKDRFKTFDIESSTKDQVYGGSKKEDQRAALSAERTKGLILTPIGSKKPMKAYYHSTCGGMTELPENVWGSASAGIKRRVKCEYCRSSPSFFWEAKFQDSEMIKKLFKVARALSRPFPKFDAREILKVETETLPYSDRVENVKFEMKDLVHHLSVTIPANKLRVGVDPVQLKSTQFKVFNLGSDEIVFRGRGYGHGVGMCQWGAKVMGDKGFKAKSILSQYYPDANLLKAW